MDFSNWKILLFLWCITISSSLPLSLLSFSSISHKFCWICFVNCSKNGTNFRGQEKKQEWKEKFILLKKEKIRPQKQEENLSFFFLVGKLQVLFLFWIGGITWIVFSFFFKERRKNKERMVFSKNKSLGTMNVRAFFPFFFFLRQVFLIWWKKTEQTMFSEQTETTQNFEENNKTLRKTTKLSLFFSFFFSFFFSKRKQSVRNPIEAS